MIEYPKYKKVLFCTDFSENSDYAFDYAFGIAKRDEAMLYILHVKTPAAPQQEAYLRSYLTEQQIREMKEKNDEDLDHQFNNRYVSKISDKTKVQIATRLGREDREIIKFAVQEKIDLITIGKHGQTGLENAFFGSVAERIIRYSPIPVFIIPRRSESGRT